MIDWQKKTIDTYNQSATELSEYFAGIGSRIGDIDRAFSYIKEIKQPKVLEIGCGDGRDSVEIIAKTPNYIGIDPSANLLEIAHQKASGATFVVSRAQEYDFPENLDVIFAFASLLHLNKEEVKKVFSKASYALKTNGVFYISLKNRPRYTEEIKKDQYGERQFFFYNPELIEKLAGKNFETTYLDKQLVGNTNWFTIALRKIS